MPVDLVPGRGHLGRDRVAQHLHDGREQVLVDDRVLVLGDAQRGVLVGDAGQHLERVAPVLGDQQGGVRRDRAGERALLVALGLVAPVEQVAFELGMGGEHALVEHGVMSPMAAPMTGSVALTTSADLVDSMRTPWGEGEVTGSSERSW